MSTPAIQLPPGRRPGPLVSRVLAVLVDASVPTLTTGVWWLAMAGGPVPANRFVAASVLAGIVQLSWGLYVWWAGSQRGATPGMALLELECVDHRTAEPVGWGRFFARQLVYAFLASTVIGLLLMLTWLALDPARRGWHDRAGGAVVIERQRRTTEVPDQTTTGERLRLSPATVALPAHLQGGASFRPVNTPGMGHAPAPQQHSGWQPPSAPRDVPDWQQPQAPHAPHHPQAVPHAPSSMFAGELDWGGGIPGGGWTPPQVQPVPDGTPAQAPARPVELPTFASAEATLPPPTNLPPVDLPPDRPVVADATLPPPVAGAPISEVPVSEVPVSEVPAASAAPVAGPPPADATTAAPFDDEGTVLRQPDGDAASTAVRARVTPQSWVILLDDGRTLPLGAGVLLGRRPQAGPGEGAYGLVDVPDDTRSVSKTHLLVAADSTGVWISDRGSTNGSGVLLADGRFVECQPGERLHVEPGQHIAFGDRRLVVRRA